MAACLPDNETERLRALREHGILDTAPDAEFDDLVRLAAHLCGVPIAAVSLVDEHRQWFKAITGLEVTETPREAAFCAHSIRQSEIMVVSDAQTDPRFADNPLVTGDPHIRFYAGVPLLTEEGYALGSLCVIDRTPKTLSPEQETTLRLLARQAAAHLRASRRLAERERLVREKERAAAELEAEREFSRALLESLHEGIVACDAGGTLTLFNHASRVLHGLPEQRLPPEQWAEHFDLYQSDGMTPMQTQDIPLYRAWQGETVRDAEMVIAPKTGDARTLLANGRPIFGAGGEKLGAVVAMHDVTARRQVERELGRMAAIIESSAEAVLGATVDGVLVSWNLAAERLFGYAASEVIGQHVSCLVPAGESSPVSAVIAALRRGEMVQTRDVTRRRKDGSVFHAALSFSPIRDASGEMVGLSCLAQDITFRKQTEAALAETHAALCEQAEQLRRSEAARRAILEDAPVILYAADASGKITLSEGAGLAVLGLAPGEAVGRSVFEFTGDLQNEENTRRALAGEMVSYDARAGSLCLHTQLRPVRGGDGSPGGFIGVCFDVTDRVASEERFRVLFEQSSDAHLLVGENGVVDCNAAAVTLLGCTDKAQMLALHPAVLSPEFQPDGRRSAEKKHEMDALAHAQGFHRFEWLHKRANGEEFPVEVTLTPVKLAGRSVLLVVLHDLTERKRQEEAIRDHAIVLEFQKGELEKANAELAALATTDGLTGLSNHRAFQDRLAEEVCRAARYGTPLALILLDVDRFKQFNDRHGHPAGDAVLKAVSGILQECARETDLTARYGGEEFVLLLPQTDLNGAAAFAERLRAAVAGRAWPLRAVTISCGVAALRPGEESGTELLARADKALYRSKSAGRNRVTSSGPAQPRREVRPALA